MPLLPRSTYAQYNEFGRSRTLADADGMFDAPPARPGSAIRSSARTGLMVASRTGLGTQALGAIKSGVPSSLNSAGEPPPHRPVPIQQHSFRKACIFTLLSAQAPLFLRILRS